MSFYLTATDHGTYSCCKVQQRVPQDNGAQVLVHSPFGPGGPVLCNHDDDNDPVPAGVCHHCHAISTSKCNDYQTGVAIARDPREEGTGRSFITRSDPRGEWIR